jgi:hypothetical protein
LPCPFYKMDMCSAVKDPKLAKLYTSRQRCMYEYKSCSIYTANQDRIPAQGNVDQKSSLYAEVDGASPQVEVDCEFFSNGECRVMHRLLMRFEALRCAQYSHTCPLRERALRTRAGQ